ncbi:CsbD family protein [Streptomyces sp. NPDC005336]|uniref:CsbD family protein n=1 Tax=unclassified Streptomyces TaxID=2593676 RepID=UPI0033A2ACDC
MKVGKKIAHSAEAVKGGTKKALGRVTGNRRLHAEGRGAQAKGDAKQSGSKIRDAFRR